MLGRTLGGATVALLQGGIVLLICLIAGFRLKHSLLLPLALLFMFLIALVFTAIGTAIGSVLKDMQGFQLIMNFLVMPLFFFSNALFARSKGASRWTKTGYEAQAPDERATYCEVHIHQRREA